MCLSPITILNPTKYVSVRYRDRFLMQVPCGKCAECLTNKSNEWNYRIYRHSLDYFQKGGFVHFTTLTYSNDYLPHISDYISVDKSVDFPCFNSSHIRTFVAALRQKCKRSYGSNFDYFIVSEYGTNEHATHRPHYHALFFVSGGISEFEFSKMIAKYWFYGRTDGMPYKSANYVSKNTFRHSSNNSLAALRYVTKYIQKSCEFQLQIDKRVRLILNSVCSKFESQGLDEWRESSHYWRLCDILFRRFNQFHRQSTHLGESVVNSIDVAGLFDNPYLLMPDCNSVIKRIPLPTYYKRKFFYQLVEQDKSKIWIPTDIGYQFLNYRNEKTLEPLSRRLSALGANVGCKFDFRRLSDYILNYRGRFIASMPSEFSERISHVDFYAYLNRYDREYFDKIGLALHWCGNSSVGYWRKRPFVTVKDFVRNFVYLDSDLENQITILYGYSSNVNSQKQEAFEVKQRLSNLVHYLIE